MSAAADAAQADAREAVRAHAARLSCRASSARRCAATVDAGLAAVLHLIVAPRRAANLDATFGRADRAVAVASDAAALRSFALLAGAAAVDVGLVLVQNAVVARRRGDWSCIRRRYTAGPRRSRCSACTRGRPSSGSSSCCRRSRDWSHRRSGWVLARGGHAVRPVREAGRAVGGDAVRRAGGALAAAPAAVDAGSVAVPDAVGAARRHAESGLATEAGRAVRAQAAGLVQRALERARAAAVDGGLVLVAHAVDA